MMGIPRRVATRLQRGQKSLRLSFSLIRTLNFFIAIHV